MYARGVAPLFKTTFRAEKRKAYSTLQASLTIYSIVFAKGVWYSRRRFNLQRTT